MKIKDVFKKLSVLFLTIFIFSGLIKWIKIWPIDATVLFGSLSVLSLTISLLFKKRLVFERFDLAFLSLILLFSVWFYASMLYSESTSFMYVKATNYLLVLLAFTVPFFTIDSKKDVLFYLYCLASIGFIISIIMIYLYIIGGNNLYFTYFKLLEYDNPLGVPDYLALGAPIGLTAIIFLFLGNNYLKIAALLPIAALILLSGRGPILGLLLAAFLILVSHFRLSKSMLRAAFFGMLIVFFSANSIMQWQGFERLTSRVSGIEKGDASVESRVDQLYVARDLFLENPVGGVGLGAFGIYMFGKDMRAYPHNLLAEILVEQGLIGIFLFFLFLIPLLYYRVRKLLFSREPRFYILAALFFFEFINALKSSSIIEHRLFFALMGLCVVAYKFSKPSRLLYHKVAQ